jgi:hypothetical protein
MKYVLLCLTLITVSVCFAQNLEKDTIQLHEVLLAGKKTPKLKIIKRDNRKLRIRSLSYAQQPSEAYLIEDLPVGDINQITLFFCFIKKKYTQEYDILEDRTNLKKTKMQETKYEVSFYKVNDKNKVGEKINKEAILIDLPESTSWNDKKIVLDVSSLVINDTRFFVQLTRITDVPCDECPFYAPVLYDCGKKRSFYQPLEEIIVDDKSAGAKGVITALRMDIKTLTRDY